jgi:hypothetical protein
MTEKPTSITGTENVLKDTETVIKDLGDLLKNMQAALKGLTAALEEPESKTVTVTYKPDAGREIYIGRKKEPCVCNLPPGNGEPL